MRADSESLIPVSVSQSSRMEEAALFLCKILCSSDRGARHHNCVGHSKHQWEMGLVSDVAGFQNKRKTLNSNRSRGDDRTPKKIVWRGMHLHHFSLITLL